MTIHNRILLPFLLICFVFGGITEEVYNQIAVCGDNEWNQYYEQCDGSVGCTSQCICGTGYIADGKGNCQMQCMYEDACSSGCILPDVCEQCNISKGYTSDCQGCQSGYMWFGEGKCKPIKENEIQTCGMFSNIIEQYFKEKGEENVFNIQIGEEEIKNGGLISIPDVSNLVGLQLNRCSQYVDPIKPYTYGVWFKLTSTINTFVSIEVDKRYSHQELELAKIQKQEIGSKLAIVIEQDCQEKLGYSTSLVCLYKNGGHSKYVNSPRIITLLETGSTQYLFIHSKFASFQIPAFKLYVNKITHACSSSYYNIDWNTLASSNYSNVFNLEHTINSRSICSKDIVKGLWFKLIGADQSIQISTCNSPSEYDINLDLLAVKLSDYGLNENSEDISMINCDDDSKTKCIRSRTDGCGNNSKLARMVVSLQTGYLYFLFVGVNEQYSAQIQVDINTVCTNNCDNNGLCSSHTGKCECNDGYVLKDETCSLCGNGKLDEGEECDLSIEGYDDSKCSINCNCLYGFEPKNINGVRKCAVSTCGNNEINKYEECDGGYGCDHCVCVNGTKKYAKARIGCMLSTCGNKKWDKGEECDGGDGCIECECQPGWYSQNKADCSSISRGITNFLFWGIGSIIYIIFYILLLLLVLFIYYNLTKQIKQEIDDEKLIIFENTIIPFDKTNSQYIDLKQQNPYFSFSSNTIDFGDIRPEINEPIDTTIILTNNWKESMHFTFHSGDYTKYEIMCKPFTGTIRPGDFAELTITFMAKCTTLLNEKIPITLRYGQLGNILKEIKKENPDLIAQNSQSSQNSEMDNRSHSSNTNNTSNSQPQKSTPSSSKTTNSKSNKSDKSSSKKKKGKSKVSKFHVYLNLQVESALSTKLDYEEIHLQHPPIGGGTFGIVYRADWRRVDVAVKVMKTDLVGLAELLPNFSQEAEMMERIRCPYIVNFIGSVVTADTLCLVTEFCPLGSLRKFMKTNPLSDFLKVRFCQDIARGMEYLHQNDILHRDLKTDNVLVYSKNPHDPITAKVTDFGTSRSFIESSGKIELQNIGTPVYMAPEISRKDQMTLKSDVYSFAICMLEIWLGRDPYDPIKFPDSESILRFVGAGKRLDVSDECIFKTLIEQSWKHNPSERPTFKELGTVLDGILRRMTDKSNSTKGHSGSTRTETKSQDISSSEKRYSINTSSSSTINNMEDNKGNEESIDTSISSQVLSL
ncbi:serine-threonine protein kinase, putative [Entamoeba dispar SAW760]|uniref:Serine-threonine protein kinase, putative n=1 Tax=Entamoeba dispar (strain ATCC PRA-260 / SAW760) TaxID=370354 RepID=B0EQB9_ENTDS|nr:serine-threonine protein kinase, putative [Entamoeba dispar SAW760]EDR23274.1 serine-threonine protein kinase, putative [Entamoeba dispar SAW760]|eukprot:EDR23274.1 serine-threonine protein kinase, putative [Entamoeba dispar SAW760]